MKKYQEALNALVALAQRSKTGKLYALIHKDILQELVDKETPMKPITLEPTIYECKKCFATPPISRQRKEWYKHFYKYCSNCGQRLDWSNDNEL